MSDAMYHIIDWIILGVPLWGTLIYMAVIFRVYPPHRHLNGKIEYPPKFAPGKVEDLYRAKEG
jgi:hypothetical protein